MTTVESSTPVLDQIEREQAIRAQEQAAAEAYEAERAEMQEEAPVLYAAAKKVYLERRAVVDAALDVLAENIEPLMQDRRRYEAAHSLTVEWDVCPEVRIAGLDRGYLLTDILNFGARA